MKKKKLNGMAGRKENRKKAIKLFAGFALMLIAFFATSALTNNALAGSLLAFPLFGLAAIQRDSGENGGGLDAQKELLNQIKNLIAEGVKPNSEEMKQIKEQLKAVEAEAKKTKSPDKYDELVKEHAEAMGRLKALEENGKPEMIKSTRDQLKDWVEANKTAIANIRAGQKADLTPLVMKLNSPMTPANTYNSSAYLPQPQFVPGATDIVRVKPTFWDYLKKGRTSSAAYVWVNKKNPEGAAAFIGPGVAKPGVSFEIATEISNAKKVAASEKCATELLEDIDGLMSWFEQELAYQLKYKINTTLMTGTASSTVPAGIQTISTTYSLTTVKTTNPNNWDAIRACVAQLTSGNLYGPITAFVNPIDKANMDLTKAQSQGQLYIPNDPGATIVEDNNIPVGYVQVALLDYYKVLIYKEMAITFGWENDDFTKNLVTAICEMRLHQFFSENHTGAFIYDTFDNIKTAIAEV